MSKDTILRVLAIFAITYWSADLILSVLCWVQDTMHKDRKEQKQARCVDQDYGVDLDNLNPVDVSKNDVQDPELPEKAVKVQRRAKKKAK